MKFLSCIFFVALCACVQGQIPAFGKCPSPSVKQGFKAAKYVGTWYEFQRYFVAFEWNTKCGKARYTLKSDGKIKVENSGINSRTGASSHVVGEASAPDPRVPAKLEVRFPSGGVFAKGPYWVLDTDYVTYSVVYSCVQTPLSLAHADIIWILSRRRAGLHDGVKHQIYNMLRNRGLRVNYLKVQNQSNCPN
ncbi:apolipoprotein D-like [Tubulanus polymorphus]|uniref:apolipoprotein D-like n=1 Tax=Tubulanus polymorphus TaxID=672921 RepID=UPI003DA331AD